ncbi:Uu.00g106340.m01.CDS01 [Anthostomella pinea]|uniref:Uu.00g106340.m01.CDS01 n=1 Tax=Anthostomella pinea TaxID=933095 RepID=A0AAI8YG07_9PEZI|nr:Uu.00g106340.m01.CDS01 [Anthostomella pinea]
MPSQIVAPIPITPPRKNMRLTNPSDLFSSLNATLASKSSQRSAPIRSIQERDWDVPAPPPPSPVSFHPDHWQRSLRH